MIDVSRPAEDGGGKGVVQATGELEAVHVEGDEIGGHAGSEMADVVAAEYLGPASGGHLEDGAGRQEWPAREGRCRIQPAQQHRLARLGQEVRSVVRGRPVDAEAEADACLPVGAYRSDARGEAHVGAGAVGGAGARRSHPLDARPVDMHGVGEPDVRSRPSDTLRVGERRPAERLETEVFLVDRLGEMGMQLDSVGPGELGRLLHAGGGDRERRAGGDHDLHRGAPTGVVVRLDQPSGVVEDRLFGFHHRVGRQTAVALAEAHRTP